jgi:hypothetical protein
VQDDEVQQNMLGPLREMNEHALKDIEKQRKKMESRRLDYDYKVATTAGLSGRKGNGA